MTFLPCRRSASICASEPRGRHFLPEILTRLNLLTLIKCHDFVMVAPKFSEFDTLLDHIKKKIFYYLKCVQLC